jgi:hypothetical protein
MLLVNEEIEAAINWTELPPPPPPPPQEVIINKEDRMYKCLKFNFILSPIEYLTY